MLRVKPLHWRHVHQSGFRLYGGKLCLLPGYVRPRPVRSGARLLPEHRHQWHMSSAIHLHWLRPPGRRLSPVLPARTNAVPKLHLRVLRGLRSLRVAEVGAKQEGPEYSGPSCFVQPIRLRRLLFRVFGDHVDGPLAARIARVGGDVEADALPDLQHLEAAIGDRGVMEKELTAP